MTTEQTLALIGAITAAVTFVVTPIDWLIRRWLQRHRDESIVSLNKQLAELHQELDLRTSERDGARLDLALTAESLAHASTSLVQATTKCEEQRATIDSQSANLNEANRQLEDAKHLRNAHDARVQRALKLEGAIWTQPVMCNSPKFVELPDRRTPIISVLNLKGGVGKTTITAYLAKALAARDYRVLLVDLDLQGSLSSLFIPTLELARLSKSGGKFLQNLLSPEDVAKPGRLLDHTLPVPQLGPHARIVPTTDKLAYAELSQTVQWLLRVGGKSQQWNGRRDGRLILRRALHRASVCRKFDVVLMDCPPLLNLCCANALAASDYVLTPVTPSHKSIERVPPLIRRIMEVQKEVNENLKMLGIVVNNTRQRDGLTPQEQDLMQTLPEQCRNVSGNDLYQFDTTIPGRVAIRDREQNPQMTEEDPDIRDTFAQLAEEFIKRLPGVCRHPDERKKSRRSIAQGGKS